MRRLFLFLVIIAVAGGLVWFLYLKPRQVTNKTTQTGVGVFFPSSGTQSSGNESFPDSNTSSISIPIQSEGTFSPFKLLINEPVAGFTAFNTTKTVTIPPTDPKQKSTKQITTEHFIRYVSRTNGYVYEIKDGGIPLQISNIYIPNIYEATFAAGNKVVLLRFLRDDNHTIATYSVPIPDANPDNTRTQRQGIYFPDNVASLAIAPDGKTAARLMQESGFGIISTSDIQNSAKKEVVRSPFHEWIISWPDQKTIYAQTKASGIAEGFLYKIDTSEKKLRRVLGNIAGLTASVSPKGTYILYSETTDQGFTAKLFNTKTNTTRNLNLSILPEKCAWLKNENIICAGNNIVQPALYPDAWYQGTVSFSDKLYRIYSSLGISDVLDDGTVQSFDAINLSVADDQNMLYFMNKTDGKLWQFSL